MSQQLQSLLAVSLLVVPLLVLAAPPRPPLPPPNSPSCLFCHRFVHQLSRFFDVIDDSVSLSDFKKAVYMICLTEPRNSPSHCQKAVEEAAADDFRDIKEIGGVLDPAVVCELNCEV